VRHDEVDPVVEELQRRRIDGRTGVDDDAVGGERSRVAVGDVDVVGDDEVDGGSWLVELFREAGVGALGRTGGAAGDLFEARAEVGVEMLRMERLPVEVGGNLRVERER
jgi:hypothetical protein